MPMRDMLGRSSSLCGSPTDPSLCLPPLHQSCFCAAYGILSQITMISFSLRGLPAGACADWSITDISHIFANMLIMAEGGAKIQSVCHFWSIAFCTQEDTWNKLEQTTRCSNSQWFEINNKKEDFWLLLCAIYIPVHSWNAVSQWGTHCVWRNSHFGRGVVLIRADIKLESGRKVDSPLLEAFKYLAWNESNQSSQTQYNALYLYC